MSIKRKSPNISATNFPIGTIKKGNDGNKWIVNETSNGILRWVKVKPKLKGKIYYTHDNGGRPYLVNIISNSKVDIYKTNNSNSNKLVKSYNNVKRVFIGKYTHTNTRGQTISAPFIGNSILLNLYADKYVYIGHKIKEFKTEGDEIIKYYSLVGNSDVPYPIAVGKSNIYFMLDMVYTSRDDFENISYLNNIPIDYEDAYYIFYKYDLPIHKIKSK